MILRFLHMFSMFREAVEARIRAEDEARHQRSRADKAEERALLAEREIADIHRKQAESLTLRFLGHRYTPGQPETAGPMPKIQSRYRRTGRSVIAEQRQKAREDIQALINSTE